MDRQLLFYIGKGGVGKSTTSAITAVHLARQSLDCLLVSMDPAHNQRDIFQQHFSETPRAVANHLMVKEIDVDYWIAKYLKETEKTIKQIYSYESAFNLQNYFNVLQFSPGLEEYALLLAFNNLIHTHGDKDVIIFDMAPTALTLRFFSLPAITLIWLEELLRLRERIYAKKEIISKIRIGRKTIEQDTVKSKLETMIREYGDLRDQFKSDAAQINLIVNDDKLSLAEGLRIKTKLNDIGIRIKAVLVNKSRSRAVPADVSEIFSNLKIALFPFSLQNVLGYAAISQYLDENGDLFAQMPGSGHGNKTEPWEAVINGPEGNFNNCQHATKSR